MKVNVLVPSEIVLKPGDNVVLDIDLPKSCHQFRTIERVVESRSSGVYAVFNDRTWRPVSTHGITWRKVL